MEVSNNDIDYRTWRIEEIDTDPEADVSIEVTVGLYEHYDRIGTYVFQYNRTEDGVGPIYIPGRLGSTFEDKNADRDNQARFEASMAVAEHTGTRVEMYVMSQSYLNSVSRDSLSDLIGEVGEERAMELLQGEVEE